MKANPAEDLLQFDKQHLVLCDVHGKGLQAPGGGSGVWGGGGCKREEKRQKKFGNGKRNSESGFFLWEPNGTCKGNQGPLQLPELRSDKN